MKDEFNVNISDSQSTKVSPIEAGKFDIEKYASYSDKLNEICEDFWNKDSGVLVYRRMRVKEVFNGQCKDMQKSLEWQLGALQKSMEFKADIPNFLEPWYGLGTVASAFGLDYYWEKDLAPAVDGKFASVDELLETPYKPVLETKIGKHTLDMISYFLDKTKGRLPMSYCDVQSPLDILSNIIDSNQFYIDFYLNPDGMLKAMDRTADLMIDFTRIQEDLIGDALVKPGHGFASSKKFDGIGMSDDAVVMLPVDLYKEYAVPAMCKVGDQFGGAVFHSCGTWSDKKEYIVKIPNLKVVDGAFSKATDPGANPTEGFADAFAGTNVVLNARIVGSPEIIESKVRELWKPGMKLIVVTYCQTPEEQEFIYNRIHEICQ